MSWRREFVTSLGEVLWVSGGWVGELTAHLDMCWLYAKLALKPHFTSTIWKKAQKIRNFYSKKCLFNYIITIQLWNQNPLWLKEMTSILM